VWILEDTAKKNCHHHHIRSPHPSHVRKDVGDGGGGGKDIAIFL